MHKAAQLSGDREPHPLCVRASEACGLLSIGRSKLYELIAPGDIETVKIGTGTRVVMASLRGLFARGA
jgi:excisionase family DNA binding protein